MFKRPKTKRPGPLVISALLLLVACRAYGQDDFCGMPDEDSSIYASIPILKQGNFQDFLETNGLSRARSVENMSDIASDLLTINPELSPGAFIEFAGFFSDFYDYMLSASDEGIGQALSAQLPAAIEQNYTVTPVPYRKIRFNYAPVEGAIENGMGYFMFGVYSFVGEGTISLTVTIVNTALGEQRSFAAIGAPQQAVAGVSKQIFDAFQKPDTPAFIDPLPGRTWLPTPAALTGRELNASQAPAMCASQNGRLPTREEMEVAYAFGEFFSTVGINPRANYIVEEEGEIRILNINRNQCVAERNTSIDQGLVLCIRDLD
jgi:hypothetical protein